jgi:hypothetical protein
MPDQKLLEIFATLVVAVGGTIGGALLALRKALKQPVPDASSSLNPRISELHDIERRLIDRISESERAHAVLVERVDGVDTRVRTIEDGVRRRSERLEETEARLAELENNGKRRR